MSSTVTGLVCEVEYSACVYGCRVIANKLPSPKNLIRNALVTRELFYANMLVGDSCGS
jgi:hypothetical protein